MMAYTVGLPGGELVVFGGDGEAAERRLRDLVAQRVCGAEAPGLQMPPEAREHLTYACLYHGDASAFDAHLH